MVIFALVDGVRTKDSKVYFGAFTVVWYDPT